MTALLRTEYPAFMSDNGELRHVHVRYGSETGTAEDVAKDVAERLNDEGVRVESYGSLDDYDLREMAPSAEAGHIFVFIIATCGDGEVPRNMRRFWSFFRRSDLPRGLLSNVRFAVFGLGDRAYIKFNAAARRLNTRFIQLGGRCIIPIGLGDDSATHGHDDQFIPWEEQLMQHICADSSDRTTTEKVSTGAVERAPHFDVTVEKSEWRNSSSHGSMSNDDLWRSGESLLATAELPVTVNSVMTNTAFACEDREVRHIELDISGSAKASGLSDHKGGDVLHVFPRNRPSAVDAFLKLTGENGDDVITVRPSVGAIPEAGGRRTAFGDTRLNIRTPCSLRAFVSAQFDLWSTPRRRFLSQLARFAQDDMQRERLQELASAEGTDDFTQYVHREKRTLLMILRDFPSARPSITDLVNLMPRIRSRAYSVASSSKGFTNRVHICVGMIRFQTPLRFIREGVASSFFGRLAAGDVVPVFLEAASSLRFNLSAPALLVCGGTGVAPMRAFVSERGATAMECTLVFGCRHERGDFLYNEDWKRWIMEGKLSNVVPAFSRMSSSKVYVQHRLKEMGRHVWDFLNSGGGIYVAGSAGDMPKAVRQTIVDICVDEGGMEEANAEAFVRSLESRRRFQIECW